MNNEQHKNPADNNRQDFRFGMGAQKRTTLKSYHAFEKIIDMLLEKVNNMVLYEHLQHHTLAKVAEMYEIIPEALPNAKTFTSEWAEQVLKTKSAEQVLREYLIGRTFLNSIKK